MNKLILVIIVAVVVIGAIVLAGGKKSNNVTPNPSEQTTLPTEQAQQPIGAEQTTQEAVTLTTTGFEPQTVTIKAGTKVVFTNKSGDVATVNSAIHPTHLVYPPLNLGEFTDGKTVELVFDKPGTYKYHDHLSPTRTGTVVVE